MIVQLPAMNKESNTGTSFIKRDVQHIHTGITIDNKILVQNNVEHTCILLAE
jgi:hypothetical protein